MVASRFGIFTASLNEDADSLGGGFIWLYSMAAPQRFQPAGGGLDAGYVLSLSHSASLANFK